MEMWYDILIITNWFKSFPFLFVNISHAVWTLHDGKFESAQFSCSTTLLNIVAKMWKKVYLWASSAPIPSSSKHNLEINHLQHESFCNAVLNTLKINNRQIQYFKINKNTVIIFKLESKPRKHRMRLIILREKK